MERYGESMERVWRPSVFLGEPPFFWERPGEEPEGWADMVGRPGRAKAKGQGQVQGQGKGESQGQGQCQGQGKGRRARAGGEGQAGLGRKGRPDLEQQSLARSQ